MVVYRLINYSEFMNVCVCTCALVQHIISKHITCKPCKYLGYKKEARQIIHIYIDRSI